MDKDVFFSKAVEISGNELIQNLQVGFLVQDPASEILLCNNRALELLGLEKDQLMGKTSFDPSWKVIHEDGSPFPGDTHPVPLAIANLTPIRNVVMGVFHPKKQDFQWILVDAEPQFHQKGSLKYVVCTFIDISSRKEFEEKSIKNTQFINNLSKVSFDAIWNWDFVNHTVQFSESYKRLFGNSLKTEDTDVAIMDRLHPQDFDAFNDSLLAAIKGHESEWVYEHRYLKEDGNYAYVLNRTQFIRDTNGVAIKAIGALQDITVQKKEHQRLELLESVITNTNDAIMITEAEPFDEPGPRILFVNKAFCRMTGYSEDEVIGKTPRLLQGPKSDMVALKKLGESLRKWETSETTVINYKKNGEPFWLHMSISPVADETGWFTHWISIERDITAIKQAEINRQLIAEVQNMFDPEIDLGTIMDKVLSKLLDFFELDFIEYWSKGLEDDLLHLLSSYSTIPKSQTHEKDKTYPINQHDTCFLPTYVLNTKMQVEWNKGDDINGFTQWEKASRANSNKGMALPIFQSNQVVGVFIAFFQKEKTDFDLKTEFLETVFEKLTLQIHQKQLTSQLDQLFKFAPDIICILGVDGYLKKVNPVGVKILEYSEEELLAAPITQFLFPGIEGKTSSERIDFNSGKPNYCFENRFVTKTGKSIWLSWTFTASPNSGMLYGVAKDVTEKKEYENLLNKANELALIGGWEIDMIHQKVSWSSITLEICEIEPYDKPDINSWMDYFMEGSDRDTIKNKVKQAIKEHQPWDEELRIITKKGNVKWVRTIGDTEFVDGRCIRVFGSFQDIHNRKTTESKLKANLKELEDYKFALDQSAIISITNLQGEITNVNQNFCQISKFSELELVGQNHRILNSGYHTKVFFRQLWSTIIKGKVWKGEIKNKAKDGTLYWVNTTIIPILDEKRIPLQFLTIRFDITEEKNAEVAIRLSNERYDLVGKATNDAIFDLDVLENKIEWVGEGLGTIIGLDSFINKKPSNTILKDFVHQDDLGRVMDKQMKALMNPEIDLWNDEFRFKNSQGGYMQVHARGIILRDDNGKGLRVIGSIQDITKLRENEIRLKELNHSLAEQTKALAVSNEELEQFAYVASHDLQEPLRMVTSFMAQLEKKYGNSIDEKGKRYIEYAVDGAKRMRQIILDLLDYSRVGKIDDIKEDIDLNELLKGIQILFRKKIEEKKAIIKVSVLPHVISFRAPLQQVFQNLIGNALKFTKPNVPAFIRVEVEDQGNAWQFVISDNGIGMEKEDFDKVFIIFKQLNSKDEYPGSGIGLAITKKIIEKKGGKIWVESQIGYGSKFYFTILK